MHSMEDALQKNEVLFVNTIQSERSRYYELLTHVYVIKYI